MSKPKTIYSQSEARRLRPAPCPDCGKTSYPQQTRIPRMVNQLDPEVSVFWHCPDVTCNQCDGFSVEERDD